MRQQLTQQGELSDENVTSLRTKLTNHLIPIIEKLMDQHDKLLSNYKLSNFFYDIYIIIQGHIQTLNNERITGNRNWMRKELDNLYSYLVRVDDEATTVESPKNYAND